MLDRSKAITDERKIKHMELMLGLSRKPYDLPNEYYCVDAMVEESKIKQCEDTIKVDFFGTFISRSQPTDDGFDWWCKRRYGADASADDDLYCGRVDTFDNIEKIISKVFVERMNVGMNDPLFIESALYTPVMARFTPSDDHLSGTLDIVVFSLDRNPYLIRMVAVESPEDPGIVTVKRRWTFYQKVF